MTSAPELLERDDELARLELVVARAAEDRGGVAVVEGNPGIGKTSLLKATTRSAHGRGFRVLRARGGEFETAFSYGVTRQLFERSIREASGQEPNDLLAGPAKVAAGVLTLESHHSTDPSVVDHGLYWLAVNLTARGPLILCVDDAHWADESSLRFLLYLVRRLEGLPVAVVIAARPDPPDPGARLLGALKDEHGVEVVEPALLSETASTELVVRALGPGADPDFCHACHEMSGGNPFMLTELLRTLCEEGVVATAARSERVRRLAPRTVARSVIVRLAGLSPAARELAKAVAVLGGETEIRHAATLAGLMRRQAHEAAEELVAAAVVDSHGGTLSFLHPMLAATVYRQLGASAVAVAHLRAARLLDAAGVAERAAHHLLLADRAGDPWLVDRLLSAARSAPPRQAVTLLQRALAEPPAPEQRPAVLVALGEAEGLVGSGDAVTHLEEALAGTKDLDLRERAVRALAHGRMLAGRADEAVALLETELATLSASDSERAMRLEGELAQVAVGSHGALQRLAPRLGRVATTATGPARRAATAALMVLSYERGDTDPTTLAAAAEEVVAEGLLDDVRSGSLVVAWILYVLARVEAYERAMAISSRAFAAAHEEGSLFPAALALAWRGHVRLRCGSLAAAQADLEAALRLAEPAGVTGLLQFVVGNLTETLMLRGDVQQASTLLAEHGLGHGEQAVEGHLLLGRARLHLAQDRPAEAAADARRVLAIAEARGVTCPAIGARPLLARALLACGGRDEALALLDAELDVALRGRISGEIGTARRDRASLAGRSDAVEDLARAADELAATPRRLEHATALVELGSALRRAKRLGEARESLSRALETADTLGAQPLAQRARQELRNAGSRPRRSALSGVAALTPSELRVADLAAAGHSNDAIAQALFVTRKTVETQLSAAYRKLGIHGRRDLPHALGAAGSSPAPN
ncbi:MAG TPA: AAA family ATPase [Nitriliruptorales bacterium]|nr:AAA family ATPase [Nitriliruptorales bacterium]